VPILDLRAPLLAAKQTAPTCLQKDTHWNPFGRFVACQEVIRSLAPQFPVCRRFSLSSPNEDEGRGEVSEVAG